MAYSYDDFTKAATNAGMLEKFSQTDLDTAMNSPEYGLSLLKLMQDEAGATTTEQKLLAQEAANQLRKTYGTYSTVEQPSVQGASDGSFNYQNQTAYQKVLDSIANREPFSYDPSTDPDMSAYRKAYLREAERAREDTLAKASANSGGTPSSFAVTAAQQAGDYYVGQLNDAIPTLKQNAYQKYLGEVNTDLSTLEALMNDRNFNYSAYLQEQEKLAEAANLMAGVGDYTLLAQYLGLTPEQMAKLQGTGRSNLGQEPEIDLSFLKSLYPNGVVTNETVWKSLAALYGADVLNAAGIAYGTSSGGVSSKPSLINSNKYYTVR